MMEISATTGIVEIRQSRNEPADNDFCGEITCNIDKKDSYILQEQNLLNGQNNPENSKRIDISYWTWNYKQLMIGIIGGCLLTILIVVPAVYFSTKSNMEKDNLVKDTYYPLQFDHSTLHKSAFMSEDGLTISNFYSRDTPVNSVNNSNTLSEYSGVIGNRCFDRNIKIYFEVQYEFSAVDKYEQWELLFEVGLAERERVDNYYIVGTTRTNGWSYFIHTCKETNNKTCLTAAHGLDRYTTPLNHQLSQGSTHSGTFRFTVNTSQETFSITRNTSNDTLTVYSFENVFSIQGLCPTFAVYGPGYYKVKMSLLNTYDFSATIWDVVRL